MSQIGKSVKWQIVLDIETLQLVLFSNLKSQCARCTMHSGEGFRFLTAKAWPTEQWDAIATRYEHCIPPAEPVVSPSHIYIHVYSMIPIFKVI